MKVRKDYKRGAITLDRLITARKENRLFDIKELPYNKLPREMVRGSNQHHLFLTYISAIDYIRRQEDLWRAARDTWEDPETRYVFYPEKVVNTDPGNLKNDLLKNRLFLTQSQLKNWNFGKYELIQNKKIKDNDLNIWMNVSRVLNKYEGRLSNVFRDCDNDTHRIMTRFINEDWADCFPNYAKERKVTVWLKRIKENSQIKLKYFGDIPIPVDNHTIRATFYSGSITGKVSSFDTDITELVSEFWEDVARSEYWKRELHPIEFEIYLWHLSKYGCSYRSNKQKCNLADLCPISSFCSTGKLKIMDQFILIDMEQTDI